MVKSYKLQPLVSVVMTTYNCANTVIAQVESVISQTYSNWELIISDDASSDKTVRVLERKFSSVENIHIMPNKNNLGQAKNFERALSKAKGEYVAICDGDDVWDLRKIEEQVKYLLHNPEVGLVYHDLRTVDNELKLIAPSLRHELISKSSLFRPNRISDTLKSVLVQNHVSAATVMYRRLLNDLILPMDPYISKDYWIVLNMFSKDIKIGYLDLQLMSYRQHGSNITGGAIKSSGYFVGRFLNDAGRRHYIQGLRRMRDALKKIKKNATRPNHRLLQSKISSIDAVVKIADKASFLGRTGAFFKGIFTILRGSHKYYLPVLVYVYILESLVPTKARDVA